MNMQLMMARARLNHQSAPAPAPAVTWNPADKYSGVALSNGNLTATTSGGAVWKAARATYAYNAATANHYFEFDASDQLTFIGLMTNANALNSGVFPGGDATGWSVYNYDGNAYTNNTGSAYGPAHPFLSTRGGLLLKNGKMYVRNSSGWFNSGNPVAETGAAFSGLTGMLFPALGAYNGAPDVINGYFSASSFTLGLPTGASAWGS